MDGNRRGGAAADGHGKDPHISERPLGEYSLGLSELLARAAAPARPEELAGEEGAVAAFRSARRAPVPSRRRNGAARWGRWATARAGAFAVALALAAGGVALAASTGVLPNPSSTPGPIPLTGQSPRATGFASRHSASQQPSVRSGTDAASAAMRGLCVAFRAHVANGKPESPPNPGFARLVDAAGGIDNVPGYCESLLNGPSATPTADPEDDKKSGHPTKSPKSHPTGHGPKD